MRVAGEAFTVQSNNKKCYTQGPGIKASYKLNNELVTSWLTYREYTNKGEHISRRK